MVFFDADMCKLAHGKEVLRPVLLRIAAIVNEPQWVCGKRMRLLLVFRLRHGYVLNLSGVPCGLWLSIYHCPAQVVDATTM